MSASESSAGDATTVAPPVSRRGFIRLPELRKQLDDAFMDRPGDVVLELGAVRHLDAVAVAVLAVSSDRMREAGRQLVLQGMSRRQERSLRRRGVLIPAPRAASSTESPAGVRLRPDHTCTQTGDV